jgi:hypothetical protein
MTFGAIKTLDNKFIVYNVIKGIYVGVLEVAPAAHLAELNEPLIDAVEESLEKSIRSILTVEIGNPREPPPNQP